VDVFMEKILLLCFLVTIICVIAELGRAPRPGA
jgi:hypothetical protein